MNYSYIKVYTHVLPHKTEFQLKVSRDEPLQEQVHQHLINMSSSHEDRRAIAGSRLQLKVGTASVSPQYQHNEKMQLVSTSPSLVDLGVGEDEDAHVFAETNPEMFDAHFHVVRMETLNAKDVDKFHSWFNAVKSKKIPVDLWHPPVEGKFADVMLPKTMMPLDSGLEVKRHLVDLHQHAYDSKTRGDGDFHKSFHHLDEINRKMDEIANTVYKNTGIKGRVFSIGKSVRNNEIRVVEFLGSSDSRITRPRYAFMGGIHAREWSSPATLMYIMDEIASGRNQQLLNLMKHCDVYFLPMTNPDGYMWTWTDGNRLWRKNMMAVDLNRNFENHFAEVGVDKDPGSDIYPGPEALSEPESRLIINFASQYGPFAGFVDFHCYMGCLGFPLSYTKRMPPNYDDLLDCASSVVKAIKTYRNTDYMFGQISHKIYPCSGVLLDWLFEEGCCPFSYANEVTGSSFYTNKREIAQLGAENTRGLMALMAYTMGRSRSVPKPQTNALLLPQEARRRCTRQAKRFHGLRNLGNSCYVASVLQCLASLNKLVAATATARTWAAQDRPQFKRGNYVWHVANLINDLTNLNTNKERLQAKFKSFLNYLDQISAFSAGIQQDADEFAAYCVKKLLKCPRTSNLFKGVVVKKNGPSEGFTNIVAHVTEGQKQIDLRSTLKDYFQDHALLSKAPKIFTVTVSQDPTRGMRDVLAGEAIDLQDYVPCLRPASYRLCSYVSFDPSEKHYTAYVKHSGHWVHLNDENIRVNAHPVSIIRPVCLFYEKELLDSSEIILHY